MKRILVTGKNSYIGNAFCDYIKQFPEYVVDTVSVRDKNWEKIDFTGYDSVFHVAGIAHADVGKVSAEQRELYYKVNTDLTIALAGKAKSEGVGQFIFMSSAIVYGDSAPLGKEKIIKKDTPPAPANFYGDSKLKAEDGIRKLESNLFKVVILRPPMIYGRGSKGNYPVLVKFARKLPVFPKVKNRRSMLYIGNLTEFVRLMVENEESGIFWPCNKEYSSTSRLVRMIAAAHGRKVWLVPGCGWMLKVLRHVSGKVDKAFGNFVYDPKLGNYKEEYRKYSLEESIQQAESHEVLKRGNI
ncbi:MAG: NAD-dependent epimerase/dehydratase family protein [Lachnospiraceae bacterium]|nr:NAD-dependent epimerase/dehydratase family protein [Lachnospiraceae bacterium]